MDTQVTPTLKRQAKAAEYHALALDASALAAASLLDRVREKHETAADRWRRLAALNEGDLASRRTALHAPAPTTKPEPEETPCTC